MTLGTPRLMCSIYCFFLTLSFAIVVYLLSFNINVIFRHNAWSSFQGGPVTGPSNSFIHSNQRRTRLERSEPGGLVGFLQERMLKPKNKWRIHQPSFWSVGGQVFIAASIKALHSHWTAIGHRWHLDASAGSTPMASLLPFQNPIENSVKL